MIYQLCSINLEYFTDLLTISVIPNNLEVVIGGTANFTAIASGVNTDINTFTYQWKKRDSDSLPDKVSGVNGTVLTIPNVTESDNGQYYCIVTNEWDRSIESNDVNFTVYGMSLIIPSSYIAITGFANILQNL